VLSATAIIKNDVYLFKNTIFKKGEFTNMKLYKKIVFILYLVSCSFSMAMDSLPNGDYRICCDAWREKRYLEYMPSVSTRHVGLKEKVNKVERNQLADEGTKHPQKWSIYSSGGNSSYLISTTYDDTYGFNSDPVKEQYLEAFTFKNRVLVSKRESTQDQLWLIQPIENGYYSISCSTQYGGTRYLAAFLDNSEEELRLHQSFTGIDNQKWQFIKWEE
jgi:hypothetical protein